MSDLDFLKQEARKNATVAEYFDGLSVKMAQEILNIRLKKGIKLNTISRVSGLYPKDYITN